jgi:hypothetical protein
MTSQKYIRIWKTKKTLDKYARIKQAHSFTNTILENVKKILRR